MFNDGFDLINMVDGKLVETLGASNRGPGNVHATFKFPLTRIGSKTKSFNGYIDDVRVIKGSVQVPTLDLVNTISETTALVAEDYTKESWSILERAVSQAKDILAKLNATQEEVANSKANIQDGISNLVKVDIEIVVEKVNKLKAAEVTNNTTTLNWDVPKSTVGLIEYVIYKDGKQIATVPGTEDSFIVKELKANTIYGFKVTAKYSNGKESKPQSINVRTKK